VFALRVNERTWRKRNIILLLFFIPTVYASHVSSSLPPSQRFTRSASDSSDGSPRFVSDCVSRRSFAWSIASACMLTSLGLVPGSNFLSRQLRLINCSCVYQLLCAHRLVCLQCRRLQPPAWDSGTRIPIRIPRILSLIPPRTFPPNSLPKRPSWTLRPFRSNKYKRDRRWRNDDGDCIRQSFLCSYPIFLIGLPYDDNSDLKIRKRSNESPTTDNLVNKKISARGNSNDKPASSTNHSIKFSSQSVLNFTSAFRYCSRDKPPFIVQVQLIQKSDSTNLHPLHISRILSQIYPRGVLEIKKTDRNRILAMMCTYEAANRLMENKSLIDRNLKAFVPLYQILRTSYS